MRTTHNAHIPGSQETGKGTPSCGGWSDCLRCRAESKVWERVNEKGRQYVFLIATREFRQISQCTWEETRQAFKDMCWAGIISAQVCDEAVEYLTDRIGSGRNG